MNINWIINDEVKGITLEEFERDYESIYGFMMINLGGFELGYLDKKSSFDEGDEDISYYLNSLIKCGITLLLGQDFKVQLIASNLLEIRVSYYRDVSINVVQTKTEEILYSGNISFKEFSDEILNNYEKYINSIRKLNISLLKSQTVRSTVMYYEIYKKLLENFWLGVVAIEKNIIVMGSPGCIIYERWSQIQHKLRFKLWKE